MTTHNARLIKREFNREKDRVVSIFEDAGHWEVQAWRGKSMFKSVCNDWDWAAEVFYSLLGADAFDAKGAPISLKGGTAAH